VRLFGLLYSIFLTAGADGLGRYWSQQRGRNQNSNGSLGVGRQRQGGKQAGRQAGRQAGSSVDGYWCLVRQSFVGRRGMRLHKALGETSRTGGASVHSVVCPGMSNVGCGMWDVGSGIICGTRDGRREWRRWWLARDGEEIIRRSFSSNDQMLGTVLRTPIPYVRSCKYWR
jgi:hypothetical protein